MKRIKIFDDNMCVLCDKPYEHSVSILGHQDDLEIVDISCEHIECKTLLADLERCDVEMKIERFNKAMFMNEHKLELEEIIANNAPDNEVASIKKFHKLKLKAINLNLKNLKNERSTILSHMFERKQLH